MSGAAGGPSDGLDEFQWNVHTYTNEYIRFADTKAAFIAVAATALIGTLIASKILDSCLRTAPCLWSKLQWSGTVGILLLAVSVFFSFLAIKPRLWNKTPVGYIFWGSIAGHGNAVRFAESIRKLSTEQRDAAVSEHLFILATIAQRKYRYVDWAMIVGLGGGSLTAIVLFIQHGLSRALNAV